MLGRHAEELDVLGPPRAGNGQHVVRKVDADHEAGAHTRGDQMGHQPGPRPDVQDVLVLGRDGEIDQAAGDPSVLPAGPGVVDGSDAVEEVDQMVDHLVSGIRVHQRHWSLLNLSRRLGARLLRC